MIIAVSLSRLLTCGRERKMPVSYSRGGAARGVAVSAQRRQVQVRFLAPGPNTGCRYCSPCVQYVDLSQYIPRLRAGFGVILQVILTPLGRT